MIKNLERKAGETIAYEQAGEENPSRRLGMGSEKELENFQARQALRGKENICELQCRACARTHAESAVSQLHSLQHVHGAPLQSHSAHGRCVDSGWIHSMFLSSLFKGGSCLWMSSAIPPNPLWCRWKCSNEAGVKIPASWFWKALRSQHTIGVKLFRTSSPPPPPMPLQLIIWDKNYQGFSWAVSKIPQLSSLLCEFSPDKQGKAYCCVFKKNHTPAAQLHFFPLKGNFLWVKDDGSRHACVHVYARMCLSVCSEITALKRLLTPWNNNNSVL